MLCLIFKGQPLWKACAYGEISLVQGAWKMYTCLYMEGMPYGLLSPDEKYALIY